MVHQSRRQHGKEKAKGVEIYLRSDKKSKVFSQPGLTVHLYFCFCFPAGVCASWGSVTVVSVANGREDWSDALLLYPRGISVGK